MLKGFQILAFWFPDMPPNCRYKVSFRLINVAITDSIAFSSAVALRSLTPSDALAKYGAPSNLSPIVQAHIHKHTVEAVFERSGTENDYKDLISSVSGCQVLERSITDAFLVAMPSHVQTPYAIQALLEPAEISDLRETEINLRSVGDFVFDPSPLSDQQVRDLENTYRLLARAREDDRVLIAALDRLMIGKRRDLHRIMNEPNWDKVVDYVIALETLFLTVNGKGISQELTYRFRLNGSSLLAACTSIDRRTLFNALKYLYDLRSSVVHGEPESKALEAADKFIRVLQIDEDGERHSIGRLHLICRQLEVWFKLLLAHLDKLAPEERPFCRQGAWEDLLWQKAP